MFGRGVNSCDLELTPVVLPAISHFCFPCCRRLRGRMLIEQEEDTDGAKRAVSGETGMICQVKDGRCVGVCPTF
jgi:hypothetical protein